MKTILIFSLICFAFSIWGPAEKAAHPGIPCDSDDDSAESVSDCVDRYLYDEKKKNITIDAALFEVNFMEEKHKVVKL